MIGVLTHNYPVAEGDRRNAGIFVYDLVQELAKKKKVVVLCSGAREEKNKIGKTEVGWFGGEGAKLGDLRWWNPVDLFKILKLLWMGERALVKLSREGRLEVCVAMWAFPAGWWAYRLKKRCGVPYAVWALGSDIYVYAKKPVLGWMIKKILASADWLFADGIDLAREVEQISGKKCEFLPSSSQLNVKVSKFGVRVKKQKRITLAYLGRMERVKGPDVLLSALLNIKDGIANFDVHFMSGGSLLQELREKARKAGVASRVNFHGNVSEKKKVSIIGRSDWAVIPSRSDSIPLVFSEAMKLGIPVIASALPDLKYLVGKYKVGFLFEPGNVAELAKIIQKLPEEREKWAPFHKNTEKVAKMFSVGESVKELLKKTELRFPG